MLFVSKIETRDRTKNEKGEIARKEKTVKLNFFSQQWYFLAFTFSLFPVKVFADVTLPSTASYVGYVQSGKTYYIRNHLTASYLSAPSGASVGSSLALGTCTPSSDRYK